PSPSLVVEQPKGSRRPIFLVHQVNGLCLEYFRLAPHLGLDQPVYGFQSRGLDEGEEPYYALEEMASHYLDDLYSVQTKGPFLIGGYSVGGFVAFEMARRLLAAGHQIALLALIDSPRFDAGNLDSAGLARRHLLRDLLRDDAEFLLDLLERRGLSRDNLPVKPEQFRELGLDDQLSLVLDLGKRAGLLEQPLGLPHFKRHFFVFKANRLAAQSYEPKAYAGKLTHLSVFPSGPSKDVTQGWGQLAQGGVETRLLPGDHISIMAEPLVKTLAAELLRAIAQSLEQL
ncbi:MAG: thioesterase domain-containing protein, partial [Blastocatellia bacterium]